eukprot:6571999-Pyramimonas_sp.AAC.1
MTTTTLSCSWRRSSTTSTATHHACGELPEMMGQPGTRDQGSGKQQVSLTSRLTWRRRPPAWMCWRFAEDEA